MRIKRSLAVSTTFPTDWPPGCPPQDAVPASGRVFRLVRGSTPSPDDFKSHFDQGKKVPAKQCTGRSLSVFRTKQQAAQCQALLQYLGDHVAFGDLSSGHGMTKLSQRKHPGHTEWWPYAGVDPAKILVQIEALT